MAAKNTFVDWLPQQNRVTLPSLLLMTAFVDFEHGNRKLFCVVRAHHLLQDFNDLVERWLRSTFRMMRLRG
jgi:hypothetical protein